jgi:uncharacterized membrane protein
MDRPSPPPPEEAAAGPAPPPRRPGPGAAARRRHPAQRFFLRGLITVLPAVLTAFLLATAYRFVTQYVTGPVNSLIYWSLENNTLGWQALRAMGIDPHADDYLVPDALPLELQDLLRERGSSDAAFRAALETWREENEGFFVDLEAVGIAPTRLRRDVTARVPALIGLVVSLLLVVSLGSLAGGYMGRTTLAQAERALHVIPVVRSVYPYTKQLVDFFLAERKIEFKTVVSMQYPRAGVWSIGFVTSSGLRTLRSASRRNLVSVFVPSSPMPMTGYTVFVPADEVVPLPFTVDEALRVCVSGGVLIPPHERMEFDVDEALERAQLPGMEEIRARTAAAEAARVAAAAGEDEPAAEPEPRTAPEPDEQECDDDDGRGHA